MQAVRRAAATDQDDGGLGMSDRSQRCPDEATRRVDMGYEPPRVERVLTPEELEQEIRYAGDTTGGDG